MSGDQPNRPPLPWLHFRKRLDRLKRQLPPVEECEKVLEQPEIVIIDDDDDDPVIIYESIAPKIQVIKASEKEVKKFINSYEESIRGIDKQTMIMQKYNDDFDFCMRHTTQENMKQLKGKRGAFITMVDQIAEAQTSLLEDSSSIIEDSRKITDTLREKIVREQEFYKRISVCVPNNIHNVTKSSKPEIPENFQLIFQRYKGMEEKRSLFITTKEARKPPSLDDFRKLLTKPELVEVKFEKWTPELEEGIAQSDLKTRFTHLNYEETFRHNKWTSISAEHALKSPEELRRRLDDQESVLEEEEREEKKLEDSITAIMDQFQKVQLQYVVVKQQLEEQLKVQSELDEIEKAVKSVQDLIREQFNTVQKECPVCYLEFTNAVNSERCPLVWQCGHTSCNTCSRTLVNIAKPNKPLCPVCRKKHMLSNFIPNFGLMPKPT
ncbi:Protein CBG19552 [Caenorhabditis briggsae]|uniref:Protein CBG19552 n=1 Tax=Caenorhabditis briggsae TaxID=6238 RepID=A8XVV9_CAEBR|nr:Protein CBG19552 [Caenorhabditis briggsae]CAP36778.1 Protein CBG19552 [Caenorhabditis briggsae]